MNTTLPDLTKHRLILNQMRDQILSGHLKPGERLPTRRQIEQQFAAGPVTVQRALDRLARDGFVVAQGRRGTFVAQRPPHLSQYALVFPSPTVKSSLLYGALVQAA